MQSGYLLRSYTGPAFLETDQPIYWPTDRTNICIVLFWQSRMMKFTLLQWFRGPFTSVFGLVAAPAWHSCGSWWGGWSPHVSVCMQESVCVVYCATVRVCAKCAAWSCLCETVSVRSWFIVVYVRDVEPHVGGLLFFYYSICLSVYFSICLGRAMCKSQPFNSSGE